MAAIVMLDMPRYGLLQPGFLALLLSFVLSAFLLLRGFLGRSSPKTSLKLPPSPPKLPIIGNLHQLGSPPHHSLRALSRQYGPLLLLQLGRVPTLVVSSAELAEEVLKAQDLAFASRPPSRAAAALLRGARGIGFEPYGEYWRQAKKVCVVHLLNASRVQGFRAVREQEVARLVGEVSELSSAGAAVDMSALLSSFTNWVISRAALGRSALEGGTTREVTELVARSTSVLGGFQLEDFFPSLTWLGKFTGVDAKLAELATRWSDLLHRTLEEAARRREEGSEDGAFLDVLLSLRGDATNAGFVFSTAEIEAIVTGMITAGTDTSYLVLEAALEELVKNPMAMKKAQDEVRGAAQGKPMVGEDDICQTSYLKAVIKEALRLHPPVPLLIPRESMKAAKIQGYEIPAKTRVVINAWAIARDPNYWDSPDKFQPERFLNKAIDFKGNNFEFIPFGAGRRICPGMHFSTVNMEIALANLLYHFDWSLPEGMSAKNVGMDEVHGLTTRRRQSLLLMVKPNSSK